MAVGTQRSTRTNATLAETAVSSVTLHTPSLPPPMPPSLLPLSFSLLHSSLSFLKHLIISLSPHRALLFLYPPPSPQDFSLPHSQVSLCTFAPLLFRKTAALTTGRHVLRAPEHLDGGNTRTVASLHPFCRGGAGGPDSCISLACLLYAAICLS